MRSDCRFSSSDGIVEPIHSAYRQGDKVYLQKLSEQTGLGFSVPNTCKLPVSVGIWLSITRGHTVCRWVLTGVVSMVDDTCLRQLNTCMKEGRNKRD
jgi:hypothetical protein